MKTLEINIEWRTRLAEIGQQIGNTPLVPIRNVYHRPGVEIWAKLEWQQLGGSVKARPAYNMIKVAVEQGLLYPGKTLIDATSGNTGIAYAAIGAALGLPVVLFVPDNINLDRRKMLHALGAELVYSEPLEGTDGAQRMARELVARDPLGYFYADQYSNAANWQSHEAGTAQEIWQQTAGKITHFAAGLGTTGSFTGTTRGLRALNPGIQCIELQPDIAMHALEGWKFLETALAIPSIYEAGLADGRFVVTTDQAHALIKEVARKEGLLLSPSAAANLAGAIAVADTLESGVVVTLFPDSSEKYTEVYDELFA
jgi:S-sulfo-L-cysteine synthase (O-acetyl-L-serine-dependent)